MSRLLQSVFFLAIAAIVTAQAQNTPAPGMAKKIPASTALPPPLPQAQSPVSFFRQLLAMSPKERADSLTNRAPESRARILSKVREYQALGPDERELRLRATELRWYLTPLLRSPRTDREARLMQVPDDLRSLVRKRLEQWDILPPPMQQEFLTNDKTLHYFASVENTNHSATDASHQKIAEQFNQFFELSEAEKQQALKTLSDAERAQMEKTLKSFEQLPQQQRFQCLRNYAKFSGMSAAERADFLKSAERWSQLPPKERQAWRDLVARVPQWPPMPPAMVPPNIIPHASPISPKIPRPNVATNKN
ncbi:MAG: DUF3106 domain-containing protein [Verrucomicrobiota bacterium]